MFSVDYPNVCDFKYFTYTAETGPTTWNQMEGRATQASAGTSFSLGAAGSPAACAKLCLTHPSYTVPCMAAVFDGSACVGYPNAERSFEGTSVLAAYDSGNSDYYLEPVSFDESPETAQAETGSDSVCTHLAAHNELWGHVAQCKVNKGL